MYATARRFLFRLEPERAHTVVMTGLSWASRSALAVRLLEDAFAVHDPRLAVDAFGLRFPSPVGLAAGLDKDGVAVPALAALGFGHLELGSVTAHPQAGNPRPRVYRLLEDEALINRMGFNNRGARALASRLAVLRRRGGAAVPIGVNVGKSRVVPLERAAADYDRSLRAVWPVADYLAINVSSPNTPGLRQLQARAPLETLLELTLRLRDELGPRPVLLKLAPDLSPDQVFDAVDVAERHQLAGIIAANTTVERDGVRSPLARQAGGLSGRPLARRSLAMLRLLRNATTLPVIAVGGIFTGEDVVQRLEAGACMVQVYTAFIYRGPGLLRTLQRELLDALDRRGVGSLAELRKLPPAGAARERPAAPPAH